MHHPNGTNPPANWLPCTPALLESGVRCATAPRWSEADIGPHWHPPVDCPPLVAYYVGDSDIVACLYTRRRARRHKEAFHVSKHVAKTRKIKPMSHSHR